MQNPHRYQCRARCRGRGPGWGTGGWRKPGNCIHGRCHDETKLSQHEPRGPTSGTKLSQHAPSHRMCGTKLSQHEPHGPTSGTKLSQLTRNGSIWRFFDMQGEFCTVLTTKKPSRENFVPNARQRRGSPTQQHTRPHLCGGCRRDRCGGHGRASRHRAWPQRRWAVVEPGRSTHKQQEYPSQANFACNSPTGLVWFCGPGVLRVVGCYWCVVPIGARIGWVRASPAHCGDVLHCSGGTRRRSGRARG